MKVSQVSTDYRAQMLDELAGLLRADSAKRLEFESSADEAGVRFSVKVPKGSKDLVAHVQALAALVAGGAA